MIKRELDKYVLIIKNYEHKYYIWIKIETPNDMPTFVVGCYIPYRDSNLYTFCWENRSLRMGTGQA